MIRIVNGGWLAREIPPAPVNVRAVLLNGDEVPIELAYIGFFTEDQCYHWEQISEPIPGSVFKGARADVLPEHVAIRIAIDEAR